MTNLNLLSTPLYFMFLYLLFAPIGYLIFKLYPSNDFQNLPLTLRFPAYFGVGLASSSILFFFTGLSFISELVPFIMLIFSISISLLEIFRIRRKITTDYLKEWWRKNSFPLFLLILSILYFSFTVTGFQWPPPGDLLRHGALTSLILHFRGLPPDLLWLGEISGLFYPLGYHYIAVNIVLITGLYPGEAIFLLGAVIIAVIPLIIYGLTFKITRSQALSLLAFLGTFILPSALRPDQGFLFFLSLLSNIFLPFYFMSLERWIVGYFFNGPYPNLFGFLIVFVFCYIIIDSPRLSISLPGFIISMILAFSVFLVYPPFTAFIGFYFIIICFGGIVNKLRSRFFSENEQKPVLEEQRQRTHQKFWVIIFFTFSIIFGLFLLINFETLNSALYWLFANLDPSGFGNYNPYRIPPNFFYLTINGILILILIPITLIAIIKKKKRINFELFFLVTLIPLFLTFYDPLLPILGILLPDRAIIVHATLAWFLFSVFLWNLLRQERFIRLVQSIEKRIIEYISNSSRLRSRIKNLKRLNKRSIGFFFMILLFSPLLIGYVLIGPSLIITNEISGNSYHSNYDSAGWILDNVPKQALILNDLSWHSLYLQSFGIVNVTYTSFIAEFNATRGKALRDIWNSPNNESLVKDLLFHYNVSYIYSTSAPREINLTHIGGDGSYNEKPFTPSEYISIFSSYDFLTQSYRQDDAVIYMVDKDLLQEG